MYRMAVWVHLILLPLLYLADGKPKPPGGASKKNATDIDNALNETDEIYHFDYNLFKNKSSNPKNVRFARKIVRDNIILDEIEVRFGWDKIQAEERVGALFVLKNDDDFVENALLYPPNDESLIVRGLKGGISYTGEIRVLRNKEVLEDLNKTKEEDIFHFRLDSPQIISENEVEKILDTVSKLSTSKIKAESVSINFKLPTLKEHTVLELFDVNETNDTSRVVVHMAPKTISLVVNDLPSSAVLRIILRTGENITHQALIFTGAIVGPSSSPNTLTKIFVPSGSGGEEERLTVKCFVKDKPPFQGFPCKGSNVCIPLHWECDGEEDCVGGFDESRCDKKPEPEKPVTEQTEPPVTESPLTEHTHKCKKNEFPCVSKTVPVCLPIGWLCDGRTDCTDGWDEKKENCRHKPEENNATAYSFCDRSHFKCYRGGCVINHRVCDGYKDCSDGSDEYDCPEDEEEDDDDDVFCDSRFEFTCSRRSVKKKCIPKPWVCDDQDDCPFGEDEEDRVCRSHFHNFFDKSLEHKNKNVP